MSNIVRAREILREVIADTSSNYIAERLGEALSLMTREKAVKKSRPVRVKITPHIRREIKSLAKQGLSHHSIATRVGLRNGGRVSEVLNGKR